MPTDMIEYNKAKSLVKTERDLPKHITFAEYQKIYYSLSGTDQLLCGLMWETGGRISDILNLKWKDVNVDSKKIRTFVKKRKITITVPITDMMSNDLKNVMQWISPYPDDYLFPSTKSKLGHITRQAVNLKMKKWSELISRHLHPHMFRHGLAIYLLSQGVNIHIIAARLGHANVFTTMNYYLVVTPDVQRDALEGIPMR